MVDPEATIRRLLNPAIMIDAIMAKRNTGASRDDAPLVIALGPGFLAGRDAHYVVETNPNTDSLGAVIASGSADENTGVPTPVLGLRKERLILATTDGVLRSGSPSENPRGKATSSATSGKAPSGRASPGSSGGWSGTGSASKKSENRGYRSSRRPVPVF